MATPAAKAKRRAEALNRLDDLAVQIGDRLGVEVPNLQLTHRDPELAQIQQMEATADLLDSILKATAKEPEAGSDAQPDAEAADTPEEASESTPRARKSAKKAAKKSRRK